jgi:DNA-binding response OmpR family regulator
MKASRKNSPAKGIILLVDDEATIVEVCTLMLNRMGYGVFDARDGQSAIDIFREYKHIINLVILDMQMPGMSGATVYDRIKEIKSDAKILLSSGYFENQHIRNMLKDGDDDVIQKPFNFEQLSDKLQQIIN